VKRVENFVCGWVPEAVRFGVTAIADHYARDGPRIKLRVVRLDKGICPTTNFAEM
jgi:hypothetical protein